MKKLDAYSSLGYSCAGEIIEVGSDVTGFTIGDNVACAGAGYANHAEVVCVPANLCVKLANDANLRSASYNTLGAIALQGIRQADLRLGESCAVVGLGLLGQLTCLMLRASGVTTYGIDIDSYAVAIARDHCCDAAWLRDDAGVASRIADLTGGLGVDTVIITAAADSLDPVNFAGQIARKRGKVVVVGAVPTGFDREPHWYRKELELKMSCSYGPGRYDLGYEEKGLDYPIAYVRWTENRNMQAFQRLIYSGRINLNYLTTHEFVLNEVPKAYEMIVNRSASFLGVVIKYDTEKAIKRELIRIRQVRATTKVAVAFIGAGSYAQSHLLPNIPRGDRDVTCKGVMTRTGATSKRIAERFGFAFCTSSVDNILQNAEINTVFIASRHDSHAEYVKRCLQARKHVFVEKPLCLKPEQLDDIEHVFRQHDDLHLMIGYNRRFAPHALKLKERLGDRPLAMIYRVNAGAIPKNTWNQDMEIGGGRIVGEVCHFIDFAAWMAGALPTSVYATALPDPEGLNDTVSINLTFANGSIGTICYFATGSKQLPKEYVEIYSAGVTGIIKDFRELHIHSSGRPYRKKLITQDKGQAKMVRAFVHRIKNGGRTLMAPEEIFSVTRATFAVVRSLKTHQTVFL
jgi:predicted dehydrogenase/threonine dehydrogenase-like Zn-dependent dehydrogenase